MSPEEFEESEVDPADWTEEDWNTFLERAELMALKYEELFETLKDDPCRERKIAEELGWNHLIEECRSENRRCDACEAREECYPRFQVPVLDAAQPVYSSFEDIPAFQNAREFFSIVQRHVNQEDGGEEERRLLHAASLAPAMIASGHTLGYGRATLCGNIAQCKRALLCVEEALEIIDELRARQALAPAEGLSLAAEARSLYAAIENWVDDLRRKKWWH